MKDETNGRAATSHDQLIISVAARHVRFTLMGMTRVVASSALLMLVSSISPVLAQSRSKRQQPARASQGEKKRSEKSKAQTPAQTAKTQIEDLKGEFVRLTGEYKKSLGQLLTFYERDAKQAEDKLGKLKELYTEGLVAKRDVEAGEKTLTDARAKIAETQKQMQAADAQIAEALVEEKTIEQVASTAPPPRGKMLRTTAYVRYTGTGSWSLSAGASRVMAFFQQSFGRQLPISAFGQTAVHNQLGFDHRNAMDVALSPASREGQALIAYLQANGIPFFAFYVAIPGSATGAHIHVGMPSHRISPH